MSCNWPVTLEETFLNDEGSKGMAGGAPLWVQVVGYGCPSLEPVGGHRADAARWKTGDVAAGMFLDPQGRQLPSSTDYRLPQRQNLSDKK